MNSNLKKTQRININKKKYKIFSKLNNSIKLLKGNFISLNKLESTRQYFIKKTKKKILYTLNKTKKNSFTKKSSKARMGAGKGKVRGFHYYLYKNNSILNYNNFKYAFYHLSTKKIISKIGKSTILIKNKL